MCADRTFRGGCRSDAIDAHRTRGLDENTNESTIEPAHETLLRQWGSLEGWLAEDFGMLAILEGLKRASRDWDANARDPAWATHGGTRLEEAYRLDARPDLAALLEPTDRTCMAMCGSGWRIVSRKITRARQQMGQRLQRRMVAIITSFAAALGIIIPSTFDPRCAIGTFRVRNRFVRQRIRKRAA
jgi:hypothetical protein